MAVCLTIPTNKCLQNPHSLQFYFQSCNLLLSIPRTHPMVILKLFRTSLDVPLHPKFDLLSAQPMVLDDMLQSTNSSQAGFSLMLKRKVIFHIIYHYLPAGAANKIWLETKLGLKILYFVNNKAKSKNLVYIHIPFDKKFSKFRNFCKLILIELLHSFLCA